MFKINIPRINSIPFENNSSVVKLLVYIIANDRRIIKSVRYQMNLVCFRSKRNTHDQQTISKK